jgi:hypothetical protein
MAKARLKLVAPTSVNRTVPRRPKNKDLRTREHLTEKEVERLIKAASQVGLGTIHFKNWSLSLANLSRNSSRHFFRQNW